MPYEAEIVPGIAAEANGVVVAVVLEEAEFAEVEGGGVEFHAYMKGPAGAQSGEGGAFPEQGTGRGGVGAKAAWCEIHESGVARPVWAWGD